MKTLEKGQEKIKKICALLREETLEPAKKEAEEILKEAQTKAEQIIEEAQRHAEKIKAENRVAMEQERNVFHASLSQAAKQSLEALRQTIEHKFFNDNLALVIEKKSSDPHLIAKLLEAIIAALKAEGLAADLTALIPRCVEPRQINELLLEQTLQTLRENSVSIGNFNGGVQVKIHQGKRVTIDMTEKALEELVSQYIVRKDFRKLIFE